MHPRLRWNQALALRGYHRSLSGSSVSVAHVEARGVLPGSLPLSIGRGSKTIMMAKKKRRRRVEHPTGEVEVESKEMEVDVEEVEVDGEQVEVGVDGDDDDDDVEGLEVVMPPLPSELGMNAVRAAQDLAGEDMLSAVAYQPRTEVAEVEMMGGVTDETSSGVRENGGRKKASKYSFDLDVELPVESEIRATGKQGLSLGEQTPDGMMPLPDLKDLAKKPRRKEKEKKATEVDESRKVARGNVAAFTSLLELDPEADSEERLFTTESYDAFSSILGEGKPFVGIANSYLQSGHTVLLALALLCGFVELQGFPLTELPYELRDFLKTGLLVVYVINTGIGFLSYLEAKRVGQPAAFWAFKGFVLGGLAFNELSQIEPRKADTPDGAGRRRR